MDLVIRLCFLSLHPVNILHTTEEILTEPGWVPIFPWTCPLPQGSAWVCFCSTVDRRLPASNTDDLDKKSIENIVFSFI